MFGTRWRSDLQVELRAEDQGSAILGKFLPNEENGPSTEMTNNLGVQGIAEVVR